MAITIVLSTRNIAFLLRIDPTFHFKILGKKPWNFTFCPAQFKTHLVFHHFFQLSLGDSTHFVQNLEPENWKPSERLRCFVFKKRGTFRRTNPPPKKTKSSPKLLSCGIWIHHFWKLLDSPKTTPLRRAFPPKISTLIQITWMCKNWHTQRHSWRRCGHWHWVLRSPRCSFRFVDWPVDFPRDSRGIFLPDQNIVTFIELQVS